MGHGLGAVNQFNHPPPDTFMFVDAFLLNAGLRSRYNNPSVIEWMGDVMRISIIKIMATLENIHRYNGRIKQVTG